MKKNIFIMIFASVISILSISNVKALIDPTLNITLPVKSDYLQLKSRFDTNTGVNGTMICYYITESVGTQDYVYCSFGNGSAVMQQHGRFRNNYNPVGYYYEYNNSWYTPDNGNSYLAKALYRWNGTGWYALCESNQNNCTQGMPFTNDSLIFITYYNVDYSFGNPSDYPLNYQKNQVTDYKSVYYFNPQDRQIELIITEEPSSNNELRKNLFLTLYDPESELGTGKVQYSYDNNDWYDTTLQSSGEVYTLPVYTNGIMYFRILDSNNTEIYSDTYNVTGLATINGYSVYVIPKGNHNVYISNFSSSSGTLYISPGVTNFTSNFYYLDSIGNELANIPITYTMKYDYWIPVVNQNNYQETLTSYNYDFTDYVNTKILMFNYNNPTQELILYIPNGLYLDYVDLTNYDNYRCDINTDINGAMTYNDCYPEFNYRDNGTTTQVSDTTISLNEIKSDTYDDSKNVLSSGLTFLIGITSMFTSMFSTLGQPFKIAFYTCVVMFFTYFIIQIIKQQ